MRAAPVHDGAVTSVGDVVGSYRIERLLGEGAMGSVFLARHVRLNRAVALKVLHDKHIRDRVLVQRFLQEARAVNEINHHHIVEVHDFVEEMVPERVYCVMELLEGQTLTDRLAAGALPLDAALRICRQIAGALNAAHQVGVIHRDVKPDNIFLVTRAEQRDYVKVLDFGVAKLVATLGEANAVDTLTGSVIGTPRYMAPEQAAGLEIDRRVDIYALGTILYEMLAGRAPFEAATFGQLSADIITRPPPPLPAKTPAGETIPDVVRELVMACLSKSPDARPPTMADVVARLPISSDSAVTQPPPMPPPRSRALLAVLAGLAAVAAGAGTVLLLTNRAPPPTPAPVAAVTPAAQPAPPAPSEPVKAAPELVSISLTTTPAGATVKRADTGAVLGRTPLTLKQERASTELPLVFELADHDVLKKSISLDGNGSFELTLFRKKRAAKAKVVKDGVLDPFGD